MIDKWWWKWKNEHGYLQRRVSKRLARLINKKIKPCPFCGNVGLDISLYRRVSKHPAICGSVYYYLECLHCDIRTGRCFDSDAKLFEFKDGIEYAFASWNMRT